VRWLVLLGVAACAGDGAVTPCGECGPGAITAGHRYGSYNAFATNQGGNVVRLTGDRVVWLDDQLRDARTSQAFAPDLSSPTAGGIALASDGTVTAVAYSIDVPSQTFPSVMAHLGADGTVAWTKELTVRDDGPFFVANRELVVGRVDAPVIEALDATDGSLRWSKSAPNVLGLRIDEAGDIVFSGWLSGTTDFGNGFVLTSQGTGSGYLVEVGSDGVTRWAAQLDANAAAGASIGPVAIGPTGEVAVVLHTFNSDALLLGTQFPAGDHDELAVISADGTHVLWNYPGRDMPLSYSSIAIDGEDVLVASGYESTLGIAPDAPYAWEVDAYIARISASGPVWVRTGNGYGYERAGILSPTVAHFAIDQGDYDESDDAKGSLDYGDVHIDGNCVAIVRLAP
jgi:hypothetical protein